MQAITVNLRGHGESDWSDDGDRVTSFAGVVLEVLRHRLLAGEPRCGYPRS
ncbi:pimeloyl-ACP methyl ester carboxylesterase [Mycobacterium sp. URHB0021]